METTKTHPKEIGALAAQLAKAQKELKKAVKSADNPFSKSKYAGLDEVIDACRSVLNTHGIAVTQTQHFLRRHIEEDGKEYPPIIMLRTTLHFGHEELSSELPLMFKNGDMQSLGSAMTYARRYSLQAICCVATDEPDDDGNAAVGGALAKAAPKADAKNVHRPRGPRQPEPAVVVEGGL